MFLRLTANRQAKGLPWIARSYQYNKHNASWLDPCTPVPGYIRVLHLHTDLWNIWCEITPTDDLCDHELCFMSTHKININIKQKGREIKATISISVEGVGSSVLFRKSSTAWNAPVSRMESNVIIIYLIMQSVCPVLVFATKIHVCALGVWRWSVWMNVAYL